MKLDLAGLDLGKVYISAVRDDVGIGLSADFAVEEDLEAGRVIRLLPDVPTLLWPLSLVHLADRQMTAKLRRFVDLSLERLA